MKILIACEFSGITRDEFRKLGHDAWSCDILPTTSNYETGYHLQGNVLDWIYGENAWNWDMMIAFPPCTHLARTGARWFPGKIKEQNEALEFVKKLMSAPIPLIAIENPPGLIGSRIRKANQYIQPWQFGHPETKMTGLWLKGLPKLKPTNNVYSKMIALPPKEKHRIHYMGPSKDRGQKRSIAYIGIAKAMADQWGKVDKTKGFKRFMSPIIAKQ